VRHDFADQLILVDRLSFDRHKIDYISLNADQLRAEKSPLGFVRISGAGHSLFGGILRAGVVVQADLPGLSLPRMRSSIRARASLRDAFSLMSRTSSRFTAAV